jgi:hypothetical protein
MQPTALASVSGSECRYRKTTSFAFKVAALSDRFRIRSVRLGHMSVTAPVLMHPLLLPANSPVSAFGGMSASLRRGDSAATFFAPATAGFNSSTAFCHAILNRTLGSDKAEVVFRTQGELLARSGQSQQSSLCSESENDRTSTMTESV